MFMCPRRGMSTIIWQRQFGRPIYRTQYLICFIDFIIYVINSMDISRTDRYIKARKKHKILGACNQQSSRKYSVLLNRITEKITITTTQQQPPYPRTTKSRECPYVIPLPFRLQAFYNRTPWQPLPYLFIIKFVQQYTHNNKKILKK